MLRCSSQSEPAETARTMDSQDDLALLGAIAQRTDAQAFARFFQRHEQACFSLALRITRRPEAAEEAVQEALLRVWNSADSFHVQEGGSVRGWLLRVVARESLTALRKQRKIKNEKEQAIAMQENRDTGKPSDRLEHAEVLAALRGVLDGMPEVEQRMLALYFGGGLSQQEVGEALQLPRRTVTHKIEACLRVLRERLTQAGFAAAAPWALSEGLGAAVCSGYPAPPSLHARVWSHLASRGGQALQSASRRAAAAKSGGSALLTGSILTLGAALVGGAVWISQRGKQDALTEEVDPPMPGEPPPATAVVLAEEKPWHRKWTFENGPAEDLKIFQGEWKWAHTPPDNAGCMVAPNEKAVMVLLPNRIPPHPLVIKVEAGLTSIGEWSMGAYWIDGKFTVPHRAWSKYLSIPTTKNVPNAIRGGFSIYFFDRYIVAQRDSQVFLIREHPAAYPADRIAMTFKRWNIERIEARSLAPEELPKAVKDIPSLIQKLGVEPLEVGKDGNRLTSLVDPPVP